MKELGILKYITESEAENLFNHSDDIEQVIKAFDEENVNLLPFNLVVVLVNNGFLG